MGDALGSCKYVRADGRGREEMGGEEKDDDRGAIPLLAHTKLSRWKRTGIHTIYSRESIFWPWYCTARAENKESVLKHLISMYVAFV